MSFAEEVQGLTPEQLERRRTGITASDAVVLAGCSKWSTPLEVWEQKMGGPPKEMTLAMAMGHAAEPIVMAMLAKEYRLKLQPGATVRHPIMHHLMATPDRFVHHATVTVDADGFMPRSLSPEAVCEGKLVGFHLVKEWLDETDPTGKTRVFPDSVAVQTVFQMGVTRARRNYVAALLGGWREDDFHHVVVDFNEELWLGVVEVCERFRVDHILTRKPPAPDDSARAAEVLERLYPQVVHTIEGATEQENAMITRYLQVNEELAALAKEKDGLANALKASIADREGVRTPSAKATWLPQEKAITVKQVAERYGLTPSQIEDCREGVHRVLRVSKLSKKDLAMAEKAASLTAIEEG